MNVPVHHQSLHPDFETFLPNTQYFFLGNGKIQCAIQWSEDPGLTRIGLLLSDPAHFSRKWSTHLFHPEYGLERTQLTLLFGGKRYQAQDDLNIEWDHDALEPTVRATWSAAGVKVTETFRCPWQTRMFVRDVELTGLESEDAQIEVALYASNALYSWFSISDDALQADGYATLRLWCSEPSSRNERFLTVPLTAIRGKAATSFYYELEPDEEHPNERREAALVGEQSYWMSKNQVLYHGNDALLGNIADLFHVATAGLRAAVAENGRFDASIWQYNFEWSGDASMVAEALVYSGQFEVARSVLVNILTRLSNEQGMCVESSRFRGAQHAELNNNGEILNACRTYVEWTGDRSLIDTYYTRLKAIADYLLQPGYLDGATGLLKASRDIWERMESMGVLPGYDVSHQTFGIVGLAAAAELALLVGQQGDADRWRQASTRMRESFLHDPQFQFVENGRIIKRRLLNGDVQFDIRVDHAKADEEFFRKFMPPGMPLASEGHALWEPDASETFPICFGIVNPRSDVAKHTMEVMEILWSQHWEGGGYGRYNVLSEPDSPGPWPFATGYIAAAYLEMGKLPEAMRGIEWLIRRARNGGSWFEFYGYRPTPPLPPTGIIVWGWAQFVTLVVKHILGASIGADELQLKPRLPGFHGQLRFRQDLVTFQ